MCILPFQTAWTSWKTPRATPRGPGVTLKLPLADDEIQRVKQLLGFPSSHTGVPGSSPERSMLLIQLSANAPSTEQMTAQRLGPLPSTQEAGTAPGSGLSSGCPRHLGRDPQTEDIPCSVCGCVSPPLYVSDKAPRFIMTSAVTNNKTSRGTTEGHQQTSLSQKLVNKGRGAGTHPAASTLVLAPRPGQTRGGASCRAAC